jgi:hypothetical protein
MFRTGSARDAWKLDRILTTHVGSLPRSQAVTDVLFAREQGTVADAAAAARTIRDAVAEVVRRQVETGIDLVSDGEMSKISYATYIKDRVRVRRRHTARARRTSSSPRLLEKLAARFNGEVAPRAWRTSVKDLHPCADIANMKPPSLAKPRKVLNTACPARRAVPAE